MCARRKSGARSTRAVGGSTSYNTGLQRFCSLFVTLVDQVESLVLEYRERWAMWAELHLIIVGCCIATAVGLPLQVAAAEPGSGPVELLSLSIDAGGLAYNVSVNGTLWLQGGNLAVFVDGRCACDPTRASVGAAAAPLPRLSLH